jgi:long-chain acyl-CoA synthetase
VTDPTSSTIADILAARLADRADETFLMFEGEEVSYRDIIESASAFAGGLKRAGVKRGDRVAVLLPNLPEFLYVWLGNALAGMVTVPMNPSYTPDEIRYILADSAASVVITYPEKCADIDAIGDVPALSHRIVVAGAGAGSWSTYEAFVSPTPFAEFRGSGRSVAPDETASIIYTSGTTGHPKGVILSHASYVFDTWSLIEHIHNDHHDRFMCFLPLFHVNAQVVSALSALFVGGRLVLLREFKPTTFFETLAETRATTFSAVPTVYAILNTLPDADRYDLSSLRYCVCGAAPMPVEVFETFERRFGATIVEGYGLSEATCGKSARSAFPFPAKRWRSPTIR